MKTSLYFLFLALLSISCKNKNDFEHHLIDQNNFLVVKKKYQFLQPNRALALDTTYVDTVTFLGYTNAKKSIILISKQSDTASLIASKQLDLVLGDTIKLFWKIDQNQGIHASNTFNYFGYVTSATKLQNNLNSIKNYFFTISSNNTFLLYKVSQIVLDSEVTKRVLFDVIVTKNGRQINQYQETYDFNYGNINTIFKVLPNSDKINITEKLTDVELEPFYDLVSKLSRF